MTRIPSEGSTTFLHLLEMTNSFISIAVDLDITLLFSSNCHGYWAKLISPPSQRHVLPGGKRAFYSTRVGKTASSQEVKTTHGSTGYFYYLSNKILIRSNSRKEGYIWLIMEEDAWCYSWVHVNGSSQLVHTLLEFEAEQGYDFPNPFLIVYIYQLEHTSQILYKLPKQHHTKTKCSNVYIQIVNQPSVISPRDSKNSKNLAQQRVRNIYIM